MGYNIFTIPITIIFITNGLIQLYYAIKLNNKYPTQHNFLNSILTFILWILAGILYPLFYVRDTFQIRWFQSLSLIVICIYTPFLVFLILFFQHIIVLKKNPSIKEARTIQVFLTEFKKNNKSKNGEKSWSLNTDIHRKAFHLLPAGVIVFLWIFAVYIWQAILNADKIWGITGQEYGRFLILTVGLAGVLIFAALDYVRLSYIFEKRTIYHLLPKNVSNLLIKTLRKNEIYEFTKPVAFVLALVPTFFLPFGIFATVALIASIGDGAASVFGIKYGKKKFPKKSDKTVVGYCAGFCTSLIISFFVLWIYESNLSLIKVSIIALGGAIIFLIIDLLNLKIDDNITNPICCATVMALLYYLV
jgi:dolichol kinase